MSNISQANTVDELEEQLSRPTSKVVDTLASLPGDIVILGVGGKMGPTLARMARRASDEAGIARRVIGVSRFSDSTLREKMENWNVETIAGDLLDEQFVESLPDAPNIVYMAGFKFGASSQPWMTWAMNCYLPALVCRKYSGSRIAAFSTGNVYGLVPASGDGSSGDGSHESDDPNPVGEYSMAALGRERTFEYFSRKLNIPVAILRLNYACELRYGVLIDLAQQVRNGETVDLSMGYFSVIWQGDANAMALNSLAHTESPARIVNISGRDKRNVRETCDALAELMDKSVEFSGEEKSEALLSDGSYGYELLGEPEVTTDQLIEWAARWIGDEGTTLGKPTKFQSFDGKF